MRPLAALLLVAACGGEDPSTIPPQCMTPPTFARDIAPIVERVCIRCHDEAKVNQAREGAPVGMNFNRYELITDKAAFADAITSGRQPPRDAMPPPESVTMEERGTVGTWRTCGYPAQ